VVEALPQDVAGGAPRSPHDEVPTVCQRRDRAVGCGVGLGGRGPDDGFGGAVQDGKVAVRRGHCEHRRGEISDRIVLVCDPHGSYGGDSVDPYAQVVAAAGVTAGSGLGLEEAKRVLAGAADELVAAGKRLARQHGVGVPSRSRS